jgi:tRNA (cytidine/uridine-2'-O-)-methyltransferase
MFNVVLVEPEIPPNTGNVIRLCANTGSALHLVRPLGFPLDDARMRRAGLDYHEFASVTVHDDFDAFVRDARPARERTFALTTRGGVNPMNIALRPGDWYVFGCETRGLSTMLLDRFDIDHRLRLPMRPGQRSLNLSNAVAVVVFEAWRQQGFDGSA